jgi:hypothetical protein
MIADILFVSDDAFFIKVICPQYVDGVFLVMGSLVGEAAKKAEVETSATGKE